MYKSIKCNIVIYVRAWISSLYFRFAGCEIMVINRFGNWICVHSEYHCVHYNNNSPVDAINFWKRLSRCPLRIPCINVYIIYVRVNNRTDTRNLFGLDLYPADRPPPGQNNMTIITNQVTYGWFIIKQSRYVLRFVWRLIFLDYTYYNR